MWVVTAYYMGHEAYKEHASKLAQSMIANRVPYEICPLQDQGGWQANTRYKPTFLKEMLEKHKPNSIIYVDVDAVFLRYPALFDDLDKTPGVNIAVHILDHSKYARKNCEPEMLSGTIFLKNTEETGIILDEWIEECKKFPDMWDQATLARVLKYHGYYKLPDRYCCIFDYMDSVSNKVIVHNQASRVTKRQEVHTGNKHITVQGVKRVGDIKISRNII